MNNNSDFSTERYPPELDVYAEKFGILKGYSKGTNTPVDIDMIAHWFDCGIARKPVISPVNGDTILGGFILRFDVLCFGDDNSERWQTRESYPLPCRDHFEAKDLLLKLDIIKR